MGYSISDSSLSEARKHALLKKSWDEIGSWISLLTPAIKVMDCVYAPNSLHWNPADKTGVSSIILSSSIYVSIDFLEGHLMLQQLVDL